MIQEIEESQVPNYAPIPWGGLKFLALLFFTTVLILFEIDFYYSLAHTDLIQWLCSSIAIPLFVYFFIVWQILGHPHNFLPQYFKRNVCGYELVIFRNQNLSDSCFLIGQHPLGGRPTLGSAFARPYIIRINLGGWLGRWFCRSNISSGKLLARANTPDYPVDLSFRYWPSNKSFITVNNISSITADWLVEMRDGEGNRIVCDWRKPFAIMEKIFRLSNFDCQSKKLLFDVLTDYFKRSASCHAAERRIKELETILADIEKESADKDQKITTLNGRLINLLMDCIIGINETKRFIKSSEARKLKTTLLERWVKQVKDCVDQDFGSKPMIRWLEEEWEKEKSR